MVEEIVKFFTPITFKPAYMKKKLFLLDISSIPSLLYKMGIILWLLIVSCNSNNSQKNQIVASQNISYDSTKKYSWVSWNVLFQPGTDKATRDNYMGFLHHYVDSIWHLFKPDGPALNFYDTVFCPCDTLLYAFDARPLSGQGLPVSPPPPPIVPGRGDLINKNNQFAVDTVQSYDSAVNISDEKSRVFITRGGIAEDKVLAIMDTGLDTVLFAPSIRSLLWRDPAGAPIRNFLWYLNGLPQDYFYDDDSHKHGTAVTSIALKAIESSRMSHLAYPSIMVLKVLDSNRVGNTFSVSCALSYAAKHNATLVNASLGYIDSTGQVDVILKHYVEQCRVHPRSIPILAAAGNTPLPHDPNRICEKASDNNRLTSAGLVYPGCFNTTENNVFMVTGLRLNNLGCNYQYFSNVYVTIGVVPGSANTCCHFNSLGKVYEGSSFETPFVSGRLMAHFIEHGNDNNINALNAIAPLDPSSPAIGLTVDGRIITSP